jgi:hypothetical protein
MAAVGPWSREREGEGERERKCERDRGNGSHERSNGVNEGNEEEHMYFSVFSVGSVAPF